MTAICLALTKEKRDLRTKRHLLPATVKRAIFTVVCGTLLVLFASPAWADPCSAPTIGPAVNTSNFPNTTPTCGIVITIDAGSTSGNIIATISGSGLPYDYQDDQLVGIQNNSTSVTVGAIVLSGTPTQDPFGFDGDGPCFYSPANCFTNFPKGYVPTGYEGPDNIFVGISPDTTTGKVLFTTPVPPGESTWFALEGIPTIFAAIGENKALTAGTPASFPFGPFTCSGSLEGGITCTENSTEGDALQLAPVNSASGDTLTVSPVAQSFSTFSATNYPTLSCVPYSDFNTAGSPNCVELELDCPPADTDGCQFTYTATADFNIDKSILPNGIGGAYFLGEHDGNPAGYNGQCPTQGFNVNIFESYTATEPDPIRGGGTGNSCFVTAFDPTAQPVPPGQTVSTFFGFEFPVSDTKVNPIVVPLPVPLSWDYNNSLGQPVTNLTLCLNSSGTGCTAPWVYPYLTALSSTSACKAIAAASSPLPSLFNSGLLNFGHGEYTFVWNTATKIKGLSGCQVSVVLQFDSGLTAAPAVFQYLD
jgi:hypothetical protein